MSKEISYTIEEVSKLLKVSKLTVYDLVKKGELPVIRVGRQMRIDAYDFENYIKNHKTNQSPSSIEVPAVGSPSTDVKDPQSIVISGQDLVLDILGKHIEKVSNFKTL